MMDTQKKVIRRRIAVILMITAVVAFIEPHVIVTMTDSVKYHVFVSAGGTPSKGDYVNVQIRNRIIDLDKTVTLTKRIACVAGEKLDLRNDQHFCEGQPLGQVLLRTGKGIPLHAFAWNGPVPENKVFLSGDHPRSFDSRYFGFVDIASLQKLNPVF